jgi:ArsR family transcriptional regulator, arsenate/arsenite/antimonite-responsive transcriptional repressor / arsenate reductase (thioredoxin)
MEVDWHRTRRRAAVHAALGEPTRLAMVDQLVTGDRSPGELAASLGLASNLLAHHLKALELAGLVTRSRSEGDRRRTYLKLRHSAVAALVPTAALRAPRILFVCTHNAARSQLAAALWTRRSRVPATSAGTDPAARIDRRAVAVARRHHLAIAGGATGHVAGTRAPSDLTVAVCDSAYESLGSIEGLLHWSVADPVRAGTADAFELAFRDLEARIERLAPLVDSPSPDDGQDGSRPLARRSPG